jgi:cell filamentation protein
MPGSLTRREAETIIAASYYYDAVTDGSGVLKNKLGLRSNADLERAEIVAVVIRSRDLPRIDIYSYEGFKAVHKHLLGDLYEWAGRERRYTTGRGPVSFARPELIEGWMERQFARLNAIPPDELKDPEQFAKYAAGLVNEMNAAHPFLEGNGRTIRVWLQLFAQACGHRLDFTELSKERWYAASAVGFDTGDSTSLMNAIKSCLRSVGQTTELSTQVLDPTDPRVDYNRRFSNAIVEGRKAGLDDAQARSAARRVLEHEVPDLVRARDAAVIEDKRVRLADEQRQRAQQQQRSESHSR